MARRKIARFAVVSAGSSASLETVELLNVKDKYYATPDGDFDGIGEKSSGRGWLESGNVYKLLARFAVLLDDGEEGGHLGLFDADEEGGTTFFEEAAGRADHGEFVAGLDQLVGDVALVAVMNDADG